MRRRLLALLAATGMILGAGMGIAQADHEGTNPTDPGSIGGHPALYGLCTAYFSGQGGENGNKNNAPPFAALAEAASANNETVAEFCQGVRPGNGHGNGGGNAPDPTEGRGGGGGNGRGA